MKCYWSASWRFVWMHLGVSAGLTVTLSSLHHFLHETVTVITAVNVMEHRLWETCLKNMVSVWIRNQWPVIMETSLKLMLKPRLRVQQRRSTELLLALKERLCWLDIQVEILWEQSFALDISHRLTALLCCVQTNGKHGDWSIRALSWEPLLCRLSEWVWERPFDG